MTSVFFKDLVKRIALVSTNAERETSWIIESTSGLSSTKLRYALAKNKNDLSKILSPSLLKTLLTNIDDRVERFKPLQYICGDTYFCNLELKTRPPILIPRPETEQMVAWLTNQLKYYESNLNQNNTKVEENFVLVKHVGDYPVYEFMFSWYNSLSEPSIRQPVSTNTKHSAELGSNVRGCDDNPCSVLNGLRILDICTGSGNIALSLATQFPSSEVLGVDIDPLALSLATDNLHSLHQTLGGVHNVEFKPVNVFDNDENYREELNSAYSKPIPLSSLHHHTPPVDIIVSNPPYVTPELMSVVQPEIALWENHDALVPKTSFYGPQTGQPPSYYLDSISNSDRKLAEWPSEDTIKQLALPFYEQILKQIPHLLSKRSFVRSVVSPLTYSDSDISNVLDGTCSSETEKDIHHNSSSLISLRFPRIVFEFGEDDQAETICDMVSHKFSPAIFLDANGNMRWVVGFDCDESL